jgi:hypothetical protein
LRAQDRHRYLKRENTGTASQTTAIAASSQKRSCNHARNSRINGAAGCLCEHPAISARPDRNRHCNTSKFAPGARALDLLPLFYFLCSNNENESWSNPNMKKPLAVPVIIALAMFCSCQKRQQTEEERNAQIEQQCSNV